MLFSKVTQDQTTLVAEISSHQWVSHTLLPSGEHQSITSGKHFLGRSPCTTCFLPPVKSWIIWKNGRLSAVRGRAGCRRGGVDHTRQTAARNCMERLARRPGVGINLLPRLPRFPRAMQINIAAPAGRDV